MDVVIIPSSISQFATFLHCDPVCKDLFNFTSTKSSNSLSVTGKHSCFFIVSHAQLNSRSYNICSRPHMSRPIYCRKWRRPTSTGIISAV